MVDKSIALRDEGTPLPRSYGSSERVEQVIQFILDGVKHGRFAPGQRIAEVEIVEALGIKRAPIREGIRILAGEGVIELTRNRGARVRRLSRADIGDLINILYALNDISIVLAFEKHVSKALMRRLDPLMKKIQLGAAAESHDAVLVGIEDYHRAIHELGGNQYINYLWRRLHIEHYHRSFAIEIRISDWGPYIRDLEKANEALRKGNLALARKHFNARKNLIASMLA